MHVQGIVGPTFTKRCYEFFQLWSVGVVNEELLELVTDEDQSSIAACKVL